LPTLNEISKNIEASLPEISILVANAEVVANTDALGNILDRIFTLNKNTAGQPIGKYKQGPYKRKRKEKGLQTTQIDFQFTGDLFNSVKVGVLNGKPAVGITSPNRAEVSRNLDKKFGTVFQASVSERDEALVKAREFMFEGLRKIMRSWS
jgi:hypothetical protein